MTTRSYCDIMADHGLMLKAKAIREYLACDSGLIPRLEESPNHFYGTTMDGLVLFNYYGGPSAVGTPFGKWIATGGGTLKKSFSMDRIVDRLGLIELLPEVQTREGCYGPIFSITKDLDGELLPATVYDSLGYVGTMGPCAKSNISTLSAGEIAKLVTDNGLSLDFSDEVKPKTVEEFFQLLPTDEKLESHRSHIEYVILECLFSKLDLGAQHV